MKMTFRKGGGAREVGLGGREITDTTQVPGLISFDDAGLFNIIDSFNI